jgi:hypothetical protein
MAVSSSLDLESMIASYYAQSQMVGVYGGDLRSICWNYSENGDVTADSNRSGDLDKLE